MAVSKAACVLEMLNSSRICGSSGPIDTMPGRRSIATSTMHTNAAENDRLRLRSLDVATAWMLLIFTISSAPIDQGCRNLHDARLERAKGCCGDGDVLRHRARTGTDGADYGAITPDRNPAAEDHDLSRV